MQIPQKQKKRLYVEQIRKAELLTLFKKVCKVPLAIMAVPVAFLTRTLRPFILIRFGEFLSSRIGHFTINTELYFCKRDLSIHNKRIFDIFYYNSYISNCQLKKMWDRRLRVYPLAKWVDKVNRLFPGSQRHTISMSTGIDFYGLLDRTEPHLSFTSEEEHMGEERLRGLGVTDGAPFVCFQARDFTYLRSEFPDGDWRYHAYRDSNILNYIPVAEELVRRGYYTVRMGALVKEALNISNPKIIDYAVEGRTDFLDIYLSAKCKFFITDTSGISGVPMLFRRPIAWVNYIPIKLVHTGISRSLFIPKKLWLKREDRFLTFREIFDSEIGSFTLGEQYERHGIEVVENTPEEIASLAIEMDERLKDSWQTTEEDEELQRWFWSLFKPNRPNQVFLSRIGAEFLRQNQDLLG